MATVLSAKHKSTIRAAFVGLFTVLTTPAFALDLDQARAAGQVGERPDGLVGTVSPQVQADVRALVDNVNRERLTSYRALAQKEGTGVDAVQQVAGEKQVQKARQNGWYYMDAGGAWRKN